VTQGLHRDGGEGAFVIGLDLGMYEDPAGLVVYDGKSNAFCYSKLFEVGQPHEKTAQQASQIAARFGNPTVIRDSTTSTTSSPGTMKN